MNVLDRFGVLFWKKKNITNHKLPHANNMALEDGGDGVM